MVDRGASRLLDHWVPLPILFNSVYGASSVLSPGTIMQSSAARHLPYLDGWRGVAVSLVVLGHFGLDDVWSKTSTFGVEFFFVLSGRLMADILFVRQLPLPTFFLRRFSRVYPGLLAFVLITTAAFQGTPYAHGVVAAALALTFLLNYAMVYTHHVALLDHLWSLCVEEHAYVVLAGLAAFARRKVVPVVAVVGGLGLASVANGIIRTDLLGQDFFDVHWRTDVAVAGIFLSGALWLALRNRALPTWTAPTALAAAVAFRAMPSEVATFAMATVLLAVAVVTIDRAPTILLRTLSQPALCQVGLWSYLIYLWQQPFYKLNQDGVASTALLLVGATACALASFYLVEKPARAAINRRFSSQRAALA